MRPIRVDLLRMGHIARSIGKLIGYARVSTADRDLAVQRQALMDGEVGVIFEEKASGTKRDGRTELQKVLAILGKAMHLSSPASTDSAGRCAISPT